MVLLTTLSSSEDGPVVGTTEDGVDVILPVPHPQSVCGRDEGNNADLALAELTSRARIDTGNQYSINESIERGNGVFSIGYALFKRF